MARYSPIAPIAILEQLLDHQKDKGKRVLGNYLLLLAHDVLEHNYDYARLVGEVRRNAEGKESFIIMDNSAIENTGGALDFPTVLDAAQIVGADVIMMPDVVGNFPLTQDLILKEFYHLRACKYPLMKVPQGTTLTEVFECVQWLLTTFPPACLDEPVYWGIPRILTNNPEIGSRAPVIEFINLLPGNHQIHLLGMSHNLADDLWCTTKIGVMGIDSANPIVMGVAGLRVCIGDDNGWVHLSRGNLWESHTLHALSIENVEFMHEAVA